MSVLAAHIAKLKAAAAERSKPGPSVEDQIKAHEVISQWHGYSQVNDENNPYTLSVSDSRQGPSLEEQLAAHRAARAENPTYLMANDGASDFSDNDPYTLSVSSVSGSSQGLSVEDQIRAHEVISQWHGYSQVNDENNPYVVTPDVVQDDVASKPSEPNNVQEKKAKGQGPSLAEQLAAHRAARAADPTYLIANDSASDFSDNDPYVVKPDVVQDDVTSKPSEPNNVQEKKTKGQGPSLAEQLAAHRAARAADPTYLMVNDGASDFSDKDPYVVTPDVVQDDVASKPSEPRNVTEKKTKGQGPSLAEQLAAHRAARAADPTYLMVNDGASDFSDKDPYVATPDVVQDDVTSKPSEPRKEKKTKGQGPSLAEQLAAHRAARAADPTYLMPSNGASDFSDNDPYVAKPDGSDNVKSKPFEPNNVTEKKTKDFRQTFRTDLIFQDPNIKDKIKTHIRQQVNDENNPYVTKPDGSDNVKSKPFEPKNVKKEKKTNNKLAELKAAYIAKLKTAAAEKSNDENDPYVAIPERAQDNVKSKPFEPKNVKKEKKAGKLAEHAAIWTSSEFNLNSDPTGSGAVAYSSGNPYCESQCCKNPETPDKSVKTGGYQHPAKHHRNQDPVFYSRSATTGSPSTSSGNGPPSLNRYGPNVPYGA